MVNELHLSRQAEIDISQAYDYYFSQSRKAALGFQSELEAGFRVILRDPLL